VKAGGQKRIPAAVTLGRVAIVAVGAFVLYYLVTFLIWNSLVGDIKTAADSLGVL
jgi:hypothetical protein